MASDTKVDEPEERPAVDDAVIDAAVAECGGDMRATVGALLADNAALQRELDYAGLAMSYGFSRGWFARRGVQRRLAAGNSRSAE